MASNESLIVLFHDVGDIEESMRLSLRELYELLEDNDLKKKIKIIMESEERHRLLIEEGQTILNDGQQKYSFIFGWAKRLPKGFVVRFNVTVAPFLLRFL